MAIARVSTAAQLLDALASDISDIDLDGSISGMPMITLRAGVSLHGGELVFGARGVRLTADNSLDTVTVRCPDTEVAIFNDTRVADFGTITLRGVRTRGQVLLTANDAVRAGHVIVDELDIAAADVRGRSDRPHGFGVDALQGAFTLWNRQRDPAVILTAELRGLSAGSADSPVRGSGVFVGGHSEWNEPARGGTVKVSTLQTGPISTDGGIAPGASDLISGGVFVISGAVVNTVLTEGAVTTRGPNDMVLDNWGTVTSWTATAPLTSHAPSAIGFVNFGHLERLDVRGPIETFGTGARGFNLYDGTLREATFASISTHADGAIGIQISKHLPRLTVTGDVTTHGGIGISLIRGQQVPLRAMALSVTEDGHIGALDVSGELRTRGDDVITLDVQGSIEDIQIGGGVFADGVNSDAAHTRRGAGLGQVSLSAAHGRPLTEHG